MTTTPPLDYLADPAYQKMEALFDEFVRQGQGRNVNWLAEQTGLPITVVTRGLVKGRWMQRIEEVGLLAQRKARETTVNDVAGLNSKHAMELAEIVDLTQEKLLKAIMEDRVSPSVLAKLNIGARDRLREVLGLGQGQDGDLVSRMQKLLGASMAPETGDAKPFVLDREKLKRPPELPDMPGMTSDAEDDERRELDDDEKEALRG